MEFLSIAGQALAALSPFLAKGGEELAGEAAKDLWQLIKKPFHSDKDKKLIDGWVENPTDEARQGMVQLKLSEKLEEDETLQTQLMELLKKMGAGPGITIHSVNQHHTGSGDNIGGNQINYH